jgi:hypothetical protein
MTVANRSRKASDAFPGGPAQAEYPTAVAGHCLIRRGHRVEVMAQIAGRREERRLAVLVAAITGNRLQRGQRRPDLRTIIIGQRQRKEAELSSMCSRSPDGRH